MANKDEVVFKKLSKVLKSFTEEQLLASYDTFKQCHDKEYPDFKQYKDYLKRNIKNVKIKFTSLRGGSSPDRYDCKKGINYFGAETVHKNSQTFKYRLHLTVDSSFKLTLYTYVHKALYFKRSRIVVLDVLQRIRYPNDGIVVDEVLVLRHCNFAQFNNRNPPTIKKLFIAFFIDPDNEGKDNTITNPSGYIISSSKKEAIRRCKKKLKEAIIDKFNLPNTNNSVSGIYAFNSSNILYKVNHNTGIATAVGTAPANTSPVNIAGITGCPAPIIGVKI